MLLRAPLRNYLSIIWPHIVNKYGVKPCFTPGLSLDSLSRSTNTAERLLVAYETVLKHKELPLQEKSALSQALDSLFHSETQSLTSGDLLVLGILLYKEKNGAFTFKPTEASLFQFQLFQMLQSNVFSPAELCIILLIFIRSRMRLDYNGLREELYKRLHSLTKESSFDPVSESCIINLSVILNKDPSLVAQDDPKVIQSLLADANYTKMPIKASVKVMSMGVTAGIYSPDAFSVNFKRLEQGEITELSLRELVGILHYCMKTSNPIKKDSFVISHILHFLRDFTPDTEHGVIDYVQAYAYLSDMGVHDELYYKNLVQIVGDISEPSIDSVCQKTSDTLAPSSQLFRAGGSSRKIVDLLVYTLICYRFANPSRVPCPDKSKLTEVTKLLRHNPPKNSIELHLQEELTKHYFSQHQVNFCYLLPHFRDPLLVFGHLGGNPVVIPPYLLQDKCTIKPAPSIGGWFVLLGVVSTKNKDESFIESIDELLSVKDILKKAQLQALGYKVIVISSNDLAIYRGRIAEKILRWSFEM